MNIDLRNRSRMLLALPAMAAFAFTTSLTPLASTERAAWSAPPNAPSTFPPSPESPPATKPDSPLTLAPHGKTASKLESKADTKANSEVGTQTSGLLILSEPSATSDSAALPVQSSTPAPDLVLMSSDGPAPQSRSGRTGLTIVLKESPRKPEANSQASAKFAPTDKADSNAAANKNVDLSTSPLSTTTKASDGTTSLSLSAQQAKDQGESPGSEDSAGVAVHAAEDLPLDQEEHPFDAPSAMSEANDADSQDPAEIAQNDASLSDASLSDASLSDASLSNPPIQGAGTSAAAQALRRRINLCLAHYFVHPENLAARSPWAVMHTILPYGVESEIIAGNRSVNAIGWMCYNGVCKTQRMFQPTQRGFRTNVGPGVQGHEGQFLAIMAQSSVPRDFPIVVGKTRYTVSDLIRYEMVTCREKSELTFKLIGLSHYLSPRQSWRDDRGQVWNLEKLVREEIDQPVIGAACGGTHRLMGLSYALMMRRRYKEPIIGDWARAEIYTTDFVQYAWSLQNPDGSFSTDWFEGRSNEPNVERKVQTTGHILEWLVFTLPAKDLHDPRLAKAIEFVLAEVYDHRDKDWPIGPRGHALRAIALYNQRVFGAPTGQLKNYLAQSGFVKELR